LPSIGTAPVRFDQDHRALHPARGGGRRRQHAFGQSRVVRDRHGPDAGTGACGARCAEGKVPDLGARYRHHYLAHQNDLCLFEGVLPLLAELKARHHLLAVATGKSRRGLDDALRTVQLNSVFDGSRTADETAGKPQPLMLNELMSEFGVTPGAC